MERPLDSAQELWMPDLPDLQGDSLSDVPTSPSLELDWLLDSGLVDPSQRGQLLVPCSPGPAEPLTDSPGHSNTQSDKRTEPKPSSTRSKASQEKAKVAQRKYRERKKAELEDLKGHNAALAASMEEMSAQLSRLEERCGRQEAALARQRLAPADSPEREGAPQAVPEHVLAMRAFKRQLCSGGGAPLETEGDDLTTASQAEFNAYWQAYVRRLAELLLEGGDEPGTAAEAELIALVQAQKRLAAATARCDARRYIEAAANVRANGRAPGAPGKAFDRRVLEATRLTRGQHTALVEARDAAVAAMTAIMGERHTILQAIEGALPQAKAEPANRCCSHADCSPLLAAASRLEANTQADAIAGLTLAVRVKEILAPQQQARMDVASWPHSCGIPALLNAACHQAGLRLMNAWGCHAEE